MTHDCQGIDPKPGKLNQVNVICMSMTHDGQDGYFDAFLDLQNNVQGCRVQGPGSRVQGPGFRVQGSEFRVQGAGCRAGSGSGVRRLL